MVYLFSVSPFFACLPDCKLKIGEEAGKPHKLTLGKTNPWEKSQVGHQLQCGKGWYDELVRSPEILHGYEWDAPKTPVFMCLFIYPWATLLAQMVKNLPTMQETWVWSLGWEDHLEEGTATHPIIDWRIPMDRGAWQATVHAVTKNQTRLNN